MRKRNSSSCLVVLLCMVFMGSDASAEWKNSVIYQFQGGSDGQAPIGSIVFDRVGNLYGATVDGGAANCQPVAACGTVFELSPPEKKGEAWTETILYTFKGLQYGDGDLPTGGLVFDTQGNLYGGTAYGGTGNCTLLGSPAGCGIVYELSPPSQPGGAWTETIIYSFPTAQQGYLPQGDLVFDSAGNLYGATEFGGGYGDTCDEFYPNCGTVFELSPPQQDGGAWTEQVLHSFVGSGPQNIFGDGSMPNGSLILDKQGDLYGTTFAGGYAIGECTSEQEEGCGIVFGLVHPKNNGSQWEEKILLSFNLENGGYPLAGVAADNYGNLYGACTAGPGHQGQGLLFELQNPGKRDPWGEDILYEFQNGADGSGPGGPVTLARNGLYTTTPGGGTQRGGTLVELFLASPQSDTNLQVLYSFQVPNEENPQAKLVWHNGAIYSTTQWGGGNKENCGSYGCGVVFEAWP